MEALRYHTDAESLTVASNAIKALAQGFGEVREHLPAAKQATVIRALAVWRGSPGNYMAASGAIRAFGDVMQNEKHMSAATKTLIGATMGLLQADMRIKTRPAEKVLTYRGRRVLRLARNGLDALVEGGKGRDLEFVPIEWCSEKSEPPMDLPLGDPHYLEHHIISEDGEWAWDPHSQQWVPIDAAPWGTGSEAAA